MKSRSTRHEHVWARSLLSISSKPSLRQRRSRVITFGVVTTRERFDEVNAATDKVEQNILWSGRVEGCFGSRASFSRHFRHVRSTHDSGRIAALPRTVETGPLAEVTRFRTRLSLRFDAPLMIEHPAKS